jgi:hypothetical protein
MCSHLGTVPYCTSTKCVLISGKPEVGVTKVIQ